MKQLSIGIIGCGGFGNVHLDNLLQMPDVRVAALATGNRERLQKTGQKVPDARLYQDSAAMLEQEALDAVVICVTPERHEEIEALCCAKQLPFYVEKPLGVSLDAVRRTDRLVREAGLLTSVGYQERYNPALLELREQLRTSQTGLVTASWIGSMPGVEWWRTKERSGGQIVEQTTHLFDALRFLFGEAKLVFSTGSKESFPGALSHDVEDFSASTVVFQNNVTASILSACYVRDEISQVGFEVYTPERRFAYDWGKTLTVSDADGKTVRDICQNSHFAAMENFVHAVAEQRPELIRSPYADAVKSCELTLYANQSLASGQPVLLP